MVATDEIAFLAAICADPGDDTARLVYADWLQENGRDQRAEFIRVQVELARPFSAPCRACGKPILTDRVADGCPCNSPRGVNHGIVPAYVCTCPECDPAQTGSVRARPDEIKQLRGREESLWNFGAPGHWAVDDPLTFPHCIRCIDDESISTSHGAHDPIVIYRRGFPDQVTATAEDWLRHADALHWHPAQTEVCSACDGRGETRFCDAAGDMDYKPCRDCGGEYGRSGLGFVRRPCPATAQPVRAVTLTACADWDAFCLDNEFSVLNTTGRIGAGVWSSPKWPGVAFTFQQVINAGWNETPARMTPLADLRALQAQMNAHSTPVMMGYGMAGLRRAVAENWKRAHGILDYATEFLPHPHHGRPIHKIDHLCREQGERPVDVFRLGETANYTVVVCDHQRGVFAHDGADRAIQFYAGRCTACRRAFVTQPTGTTFALTWTISPPFLVTPTTAG